MDIHLEILRSNSPSDLFRQATDLIHSCEGPAACSQRHLEQCTRAEDAIAVGAFVRGRLVGIATAQAQDTKDWIKRHAELRDWKDEDFVGVLVHVSVHPEFRGLGIGSALRDRRLDFLRQIGSPVAVALAWLNGGTHTSVPLLEAAGFRRLATIDAYYREAFRAAKQPCLVCGAECQCSAALYGLRLI